MALVPDPEDGLYAIGEEGQLMSPVYAGPIGGELTQVGWTEGFNLDSVSIELDPETADFDSWAMTPKSISFDLSPEAMEQLRRVLGQ